MTRSRLKIDLKIFGTVLFENCANENFCSTILVLHFIHKKLN
jgi:hypothetical protein